MMGYARGTGKLAGLLLFGNLLTLSLPVICCCAYFVVAPDVVVLLLLLLLRMLSCR